MICDLGKLEAFMRENNVTLCFTGKNYVLVSSDGKRWKAKHLMTLLKVLCNDLHFVIT